MLTVLQSYSLIQELQESEGINHEMAAYRHRSIEGEDLYKVVLLGDYGVGKTSLFRRLRDGSFAEGLSTSLSSVGMDKCTRSFQMDNGTSVKLDIWDTAGIERYRSITKSYYTRAKAVVFVYDITSYATLHALTLWIEDAKNYAPDAVPILIGNKFDAQNQDVDQGISSVFAENNNIKLHFRVSVKQNEGIWETFQAIAQHLHFTSSSDLSETLGQWHELSIDDTYLIRGHQDRCAGACSRS